jgi:NIPSNAP
VIIEQRTYMVKPGAVPAYLEIYKNEGLAVQTRHLPRMLGYFFSEVGALNQIVHMWGYADLEERTRCRAALVADPEWQKTLKKLLELIVNMENKILLPADFSPIK